MRIFNYKEFINENMSLAKAVLRKKNIEVDDERFNAIISKTNKDGFTGYITKLVFVEGIDVEEALDLYDEIKKSKINLADITNLPYEDVLDKVFGDFETNDKPIKIGEYKDYVLFYVKTYEIGLCINSPSWCLKTKSHWDAYNNKKGKNYVAIKKKYVSGTKTSLSVPNNFFGHSYRNNVDPNIRIGITIYPSGRFEFFDDDNKFHYSASEVSLISKICIEWANKNLQKEAEVERPILDELYDSLSDLLEVNGLDFSFNDRFKTLDIKMDTLKQILNYTFKGGTIKDAIILNEIDLLDREDFVSYCAGMDAILYLALGPNENCLAGYYMSEAEPQDLWYRYRYGCIKSYWGQRLVLQSYKSIDEFRLTLNKSVMPYLINDEVVTVYDETGIKKRYPTKLIEQEKEYIVIDTKEFTTRIDLTKLMNIINDIDYRIQIWFNRESLDLTNSNVMEYFGERLGDGGIEFVSNKEDNTITIKV
jgi:hypothetical protein